MVGPIDSKLYADQLLSNVSIAWQNNAFVCDTVFPELQVKDKTGLYWKYGKEKFGQTNDVRAPGTYAQVVGYDLTQASYGPLLDHSLDAMVTDEVADVASAPLDPGVDATELVTEKIMVNKEIDAYNQCSNTSTLTQNVTLSGTSRWNDYANSDPIGDFRTAIDAVSKAVIKPTNQLTVLIGREAYNVLRDHPQFIERIKHSQLGILTTDLLANILEVKQVIIAESQYNSAGQGLTASMGYIWGKNAWVMYIDPQPGMRKVTFGFTLRKGPRTVFRFRDERAEADYIRVKDYYQQLIVQADAAYFIKTVVN